MSVPLIVTTDTNYIPKFFANANEEIAQRNSYLPRIFHLLKVLPACAGKHDDALKKAAIQFEKQIFDQAPNKQKYQEELQKRVDQAQAVQPPPPPQWVPPQIPQQQQQPTQQKSIQPQTLPSKEALKPILDKIKPLIERYKKSGDERLKEVLTRLKTLNHNPTMTVDELRAIEKELQPWFELERTHPLSAQPPTAAPPAQSTVSTKPQVPNLAANPVTNAATIPAAIPATNPAGNPSANPGGVAKSRDRGAATLLHAKTVALLKAGNRDLLAKIGEPVQKVVLKRKMVIDFPSLLPDENSMKCPEEEEAQDRRDPLTIWSTCDGGWSADPKKPRSVKYASPSYEEIIEAIKTFEHPFFSPAIPISGNIILLKQHSGISEVQHSLTITLRDPMPSMQLGQSELSSLPLSLSLSPDTSINWRSLIAATGAQCNYRHGPWMTALLHLIQTHISTLATVRKEIEVIEAKDSRLRMKISPADTAGINLVCSIKGLDGVGSMWEGPPLTLHVSYDYPSVAPKWKIPGAGGEYFTWVGASGWARDVQRELATRLAHAPKPFTISTLISLWAAVHDLN